MKRGDEAAETRDMSIVGSFMTSCRRPSTRLAGDSYFAHKKNGRPQWAAVSSFSIGTAGFEPAAP
jgi:hypothetical protein